MKNKLLIFFLLSTSLVKASDSLVIKIDAMASFLTTDHLQDFYFINEKDEIVKYEFSTKQFFTYSNKQLGKPVYLDASNPLKILALYPDFNSVVWLDNTMSAIQIIKLNQLPEGKNYVATTLCRGREDNTFWIFDILSNKLIQLDERGNTLLQSETFTDMFSNELIPKQLLFSDEMLYVNCMNDQILLFDVFANYVSEMNIESEGFLQINDKKFLFLRDQTLNILEPSLYNPTSYKLPMSEVQQVQLQQDKIFLRTGDAILVYTSTY